MNTPTLDIKLLTEALDKLMDQKLDQRFEILHERIYQLENSRHQSNSSKGRATKDEFASSNDEEKQFERRYKADRHFHKQGDDAIKGIKLKIPSCQGKSDPKAYLEWERKIEMVFECNIYTDEQKVKLATVQFTDYASIWWDQLCLSRRRNRERAVETWDEMRSLMRKRFVPNYYSRDFHHRRQALTQGNMSVENYYKQMEMDIMKADI